jgi:hypothetical protein
MTTQTSGRPRRDRSRQLNDKTTDNVVGRSTLITEGRPL